ncbi:unnamed protein product [Protopolystoma xenopodis]|uniref:28S ribosomal protein S14, mitochondrial n=1 Tax=Protopolystoma xenopodis TaxID=117903 RepID=A0A3S5AIA2_9PLAT|nr:unnamed protein product [Protopolystoma xenopodis]
MSVLRSTKSIGIPYSGFYFNKLSQSCLSSSLKKRNFHSPLAIPSSIIASTSHEPAPTPAHHSNEFIENMLKKELCDFPPYKSRKIKPGFQDARMIRDFKRREISAHFIPLRIRLNAIRKNQILPKDIQDKASLQLHSLPRDSCWTRIHKRCTFTSRPRGVPSRWRISRIVWRNFADYNRMSGALWACWISKCRSERRYMKWPPPSGQSVKKYVDKYYLNLADQ